MTTNTEGKSKKSPCDICKRSYHNVKKHKLAIHELQRPYSCKVCSKSFNDTSSLKRHHALHESKAKDEKLFKCDLCEKSFSTKQYVIRHEELAHKSDHFDCSKCDRKVKGKYAFNQHLKCHTTSFQCFKCDKVFGSPEYLRKHKYNIHLKNERVPCKECDSTFKAVEYLRKHIKHRHTVKYVGRWKCAVCNKDFSGQGALINHKRIHNNDGIKCDFCSKTFIQKSNLNIHVKRIHTGEMKDLICKVCSKTFGCSSKLSMHIMRHKGVKQYVCSCGVRFSENRLKKANAEESGCYLNL